MPNYPYNCNYNKVGNAIKVTFYIYQKTTILVNIKASVLLINMDNY